MTYTIRSFIASTGERYSLLFDNDADGFPAFYPTAFISRVVRLRSGHGTQKVYLEALKRLHEWEALEKIDLEIRFQTTEFLRANEIDSLVNHLRAARRGARTDNISPSKGNTFVAYVAEYVRWLACSVITDSNTLEIRAALDTQDVAFKQNKIRKKGSESASAQELNKKKLPETNRTQLIELFNAPISRMYRIADEAARFRNVLMLRILYETGMRLGELLSLKLKNFLESAGGPHSCLVIERNHDDIFDTRIHQPVAKTDGRTVPISEEAETQLINYIISYRAETANAKFSSDSFIFINHRAGRSQGCPLSLSAFNQAIQNLEIVFPKLNPLNPHMLRHDWNYRFSKVADAKRLKPEKERELREILMGWSTGSKMARLYNRRHIEEEAKDYGLAVAKDTGRK